MFKFIKFIKRFKTTQKNNMLPEKNKHVINDTSTPYYASPLMEPRPNICIHCIRFNCTCPYGHNQSAIGCDSFIIENNGSEVDSKESDKIGWNLNCPSCGSHNIFIFGKRFECKDCGSLFS